MLHIVHHCLTWHDISIIHSHGQYEQQCGIERFSGGFFFDVMDMVQHGTTRMNNFLKYETIFKE